MYIPEKGMKSRMYGGVERRPHTGSSNGRSVFRVRMSALRLERSARSHHQSPYAMRGSAHSHRQSPYAMRGSASPVAIRHARVRIASRHTPCKGLHVRITSHYKPCEGPCVRIASRHCEDPNIILIANFIFIITIIS